LVKLRYFVVSAVMLAGALFAQSPGVQRTVVERADVSVPGREAVIVHVEIAPGVAVGRHTHPGEEITYVIEGEGELLVEGQPTRKLKAGDGFIVPAGARHDVRNTGSKPLVLAATYVVEKGKPISTPAP
jgi:quercetin dioxygenase-like cupin family protein